MIAKTTYCAILGISVFDIDIEAMLTTAERHSLNTPISFTRKIKI